MDINVTVKFDSPEFIATLLALADSIDKAQLAATLAVNKESITKVKEINDDRNDTKDKTVKGEVKTIALEDVRAKLASLSQAGKQPQVKALIKRFGANKLTEVDPQNYEALLKEAEEI